jgi:hypothetical protein
MGRSSPSIRPRDDGGVVDSIVAVLMLIEHATRIRIRLLLSPCLNASPPRTTPGRIITRSGLPFLPAHPFGHLPQPHALAVLFTLDVAAGITRPRLSR